MIDSITENTKENVKDALERFHEEQKNFRREVRNQTLNLIITSFGLVAGLAWNEAIKSLIEHLFPVSTNGVIAKIIYAVFITIVVVSASYSLSRIKNKKEI